MPQLSLHSPIGDLTISEDDRAIVSVDWGWGMEQTETPLRVKAKQQLEAYFDGLLKEFDLPLRPAGTPFQNRVFGAMCRIPYGETATYGELAHQVGSVARAIGQACGANPIPIIIPCHRVLAADDRLGGYSGDGGVETKVALLRLEGVLL